MKRKMFATVAAMTAFAGMPADVAAQLHVTPAIGAYIPASNLRDLRDQTQQRRLEREGTFGLGLNLDAGWLRGSLAYASGATISESGVENRDALGDGTVLAIAADIVYRPLPRVLVQPYLLGGLGLKRLDYSYTQEGLSHPLPADRREVAIHGGFGADLMLGRIGIMAEITDYITRHEGGGFGQHDAFAFVGLRYRLGQ
jgi:hypothetical protein